MALRSLRACVIAAGLAAVAAPALAAEGDDPVAARVNGEVIRESDVRAFYETLPQAKQIPLQMVFPKVVEHMVDAMVVTDAARAEDLQEEPAIRKRIAFLEERVLQDAYLTRLVEDRLTDERLRAEYDKQMEGEEAQQGKLYDRFYHRTAALLHGHGGAPFSFSRLRF